MNSVNKNDYDRFTHNFIKMLKIFYNEESNKKLTFNEKKQNEIRFKLFIEENKLFTEKEFKFDAIGRKRILTIGEKICSAVEELYAYNKKSYDENLKVSLRRCINNYLNGKNFIGKKTKGDNKIHFIDILSALNHKYKFFNESDYSKFINEYIKKLCFLTNKITPFYFKNIEDVLTSIVIFHHKTEGDFKEELKKIKISSRFINKDKISTKILRDTLISSLSVTKSFKNSIDILKQNINYFSGGYHLMMYEECIDIINPYISRLNVEVSKEDIISEKTNDITKKTVNKISEKLIELINNFAINDSEFNEKDLRKYLCLEDESFDNPTRLSNFQNESVLKFLRAIVIAIKYDGDRDKVNQTLSELNFVTLRECDYYSYDQGLEFDYCFFESLKDKKKDDSYEQGR